MSASRRHPRGRWVAAWLAMLPLGATLAFGTTSGPDVTVLSIGSFTNFTAAGPENGYRAYAMGTTACNIGSQPLWWCGSNTGYCSDAQHPVIAQGIYRLKNGRFEQIAMSWVSHTYTAENRSSPYTCNPNHSCVAPPHGSDQLGSSCFDRSNGDSNGTRPLEMRSEVDSTNGSFAYPYTQVPTSGATDQRLKVLDADLDPALNPYSLYFAEAQYLSADDAAANNGLNNASWALMAVDSGSARDLSSVDMGKERSAVYGWKLEQLGVEVTDVDFTSDGSTIVERFEVGRSAKDLGGGLWHYEYVVRNMNSERAARAFTVTFQPTTTVSNAGVHVIAHHSGEPYDTDTWDVDESAGNAVTWSTDTADVNPNANALRWGTMFSFWVDADQPPGNTSLAIGLFTAGSPATVVSDFEPLLDDGFESGSSSAWSAVTP